MSISDCSAGLCSSDLTRTGELDSVIIADLSFVRPYPILYHSFIKEWLSGDKRMLLKDKVAVISGAAGVRGIGYATAKLFASQGAKVVILDLDASASTKAADSLGGEHLGLACDVADRSSCALAVGPVMANFGCQYGLLNNPRFTT